MNTVSLGPAGRSTASPSSRLLADVSGRSIAISPTANGSFDNFLVTLSGFPDDGQATVNIYNQSVPSYAIESDPFYYMNSVGHASFTFIPEFVASAGTYVVSANETGAPNVTALFTYSPNSTNLTAMPSTVASGGSVNLYGTNYTPSAEYTAYIGRLNYYEYIGSGYTNAWGNVSTSVTLPLVPGGTYILFVQDSEEQYAATTITVTAPPPVLTLTPNGGNPGTSVSASGTGLTPTVPFNVFFGDLATPVCSGSVASDGSYSCSFQAPSYATGTATVQAIDENGVSASAPFTVDAIQVRELKLSQTAGYFLTLPTGDIPKYDYKVDDNYGFQLSYWRLDTVNQAEVGSSDRQAEYSGSYVFMKLNYTTNAVALLAFGEKGIILSDLYIKGYTNLDGQVEEFLTITFTDAVIKGESTDAVNGSVPVISLNVTFGQLDLQYKKVDIGQGATGTLAGADEATLEISAQVGDPTGPWQYIMTSSRDDGGVTEAGRTGTVIPAWDYATPDYLNMTAEWSGGADFWFLTTSHLTWLDIIAFETSFNGVQHQQVAFDFTDLSTERVVLTAYDSFVPFFNFYLEYGTVGVQNLAT